MPEERPFFRIPVDGDEDNPWPIFRRLLASHDELEELRGLMEDGCHVAIMMRSGEWIEGGRTILGQCHLMTAGAKLRPLFLQLLEDTLGYEPSFLILFSADWWEGATAMEREILVFHEALHAGQARDRDGEPRFNQATGDPILTIRPHDVEEFTAVVARYGAWDADLREFLEAANLGEAKVARGRRSVA